MTFFAVGCAAHPPGAPAHSPASRPAATQPKRVTGIGGVFFTAKDPAAVRQWYAKHLGLKINDWGTDFEWRQADDPAAKGFTHWGPFKENPKHFRPSTKPFMINFRVENLEWLLEQLTKEGVTIVGPIKQETYGKFAWIMDVEGNKVELWEPNDAEYEKMIGPVRTK